MIPFMKSTILCLIFLAGGNAMAQYGDAYHKADVELINKNQKAYTDAYIDALRYNRNSPTKTGAGKSGQGSAAAQQLADLFAARAGRETSTQKAERLQKAAERYEEQIAQQAKNHESYMEAARDDEARERYLMQPKVTMYANAGFQPLEAKVLGQSHVKSRLSSNKKYSIYYEVYPQQSLLAKEAFLLFKEKQSVASFEELFNLVVEFNVAPLSALQCLKLLEKRFPDKKQVIEASYLLNISSFWGAVNDYTYYPPAGWADEETKKTMFDIFLKAFETAPETAFFVAAKSRPDYNPLKQLAQTQFAKGKHSEAAQLAKKALQSAAPEGLNDNDKKNAISSFAPLLTNSKLKKADRLTAQEIATIARNYKLRSTDVVEFLTDAQATYHTARLYYGKYYYPVTYTVFKEAGFGKMLQELGGQGDMDALNVYALGVAMGKEKEKPEQAFLLWQKAAGAGNAHAMYNLFAASKWGLSWYKPAHLAQAKQMLPNFKPATKTDEYILLGYRDKLKEFMR
ncbi:MAG: hypothetical protein EOO03_11125 [Chitinophagaceae bacterium]|nr:MAG: hypothetical protein EOO03_11125 [Chitinophagaceae bacterium]